MTLTAAIFAHLGNEQSRGDLHVTAAIAASVAAWGPFIHLGGEPCINTKEWYLNYMSYI
jgi:hypothetical protein